MAQKLSAFATKQHSAANNVATQMGGGTTRAEMEGIAEVLKVMSLRPDLAAPILRLCDQTKTLPHFG
jgi:hypothetical protein